MAASSSDRGEGMTPEAPRRTEGESVFVVAGDSLQPDVPLGSQCEDTLGRYPFAATIARSILRLPGNSPFVIGVQGDWGAGKSTLLRFIATEVVVSDPPDIVLVEFNPWWFAGLQNLTLGFFDQLEAALRTKPENRVLKDLADKVSGLSGSLKWLAPIPGVGESLKTAAELVEKLASKASEVLQEKRSDVIARRADLEECLKKEKIRLIVLVDDIDRLSGEEARLVLQLVKGLAGWRNTIFVLAYDRGQLVKQIGGEDEFLDKIVQVQFDLPAPDRLLLRRELEGGLNGLFGLSSVPIELSDWEVLYGAAIRYLISSPRDVVRLLNACRGHFGGVRDEVYPLDFVAVQVLRLFFPQPYHMICRRPALMVPAYHRNIAEALDGVLDRKDAEQRVEEVVESEPREDMRAPLEALVRFLFVSDVDQRKTRSRFRVRVPEYLDRYFEHRVREGEICQALILQIRNAVSGGSREEVHSVLADLERVRDTHGTSLLRSVLDYLRNSDFVEGLAEDEKVRLFLGMVDIAGVASSASAGDRGMFDLPLMWNVVAISYQVLSGLSAAHRLCVFSEALQSSVDLHLPLAILDRSDEITASGEDAGGFVSLFSKARAELLRATLVRRLAAQWSDFDAALDNPGFARILRQWAKWRPVPARAWLSRALSDQDRFVVIVSGLSSRWVGGGSDRAEIDLKGLVELSGRPVSYFKRKARSALRRPSGLDAFQRSVMEIVASSPSESM